MGFSLILRAFFSFPNERQFIECQFFWEFRDTSRSLLDRSYRDTTNCWTSSGAARARKTSATSRMPLSQASICGSTAFPRSGHASMRITPRGFWTKRNMPLPRKATMSSMPICPVVWMRQCSAGASLLRLCR